MGIASAWAGWLDYHRANGFAVEHFLNPPAAPGAVAALGDAIGFAIPDDLSQLWSHADGQIDIFSIDDPAPGAIVSPLFGSYAFCPTEEALRQYRLWQDVRAQGLSGVDDAITVRGDDPVYAEYWRPGWLPFALDGGGNAYAVDLSPPPGGTYGQIIVIGPDEDRRRILAPGIAALLADASARRPALDHSQGEPPQVFFDMESAGGA